MDKESFEYWYEKVYYQRRIDTVKFYRYFGEIPCQGISTEWCRKICLSKQLSFDTGPMINYPDECPYNNFGFLAKLIELLNAEYFVFFSSGCIEKVKWYPEGMVELCEKFPKKIFQFYLRKYHSELPFLPSNGRYSLTIDYTTQFNILNAFYDSKIHNINVIEHSVNSNLIELLLSNIYKTDRVITSCVKCIKADYGQYCINKLNNRKLLIMDFMDSNYNAKGFPVMTKSDILNNRDN